MKTYFCVTSTFYDNGKVAAAITDSREADQKPENSYKSLNKKDVYNDWFESKEEADEYIKECKNA
ncbi:MAG TPA: hypothetical protein DCE48_04925 [Lachnospiraceae bacterium]|nr:hypothetical protein [Lachnospiraceae bacterium]